MYKQLNENSNLKIENLNNIIALQQQQDSVNQATIDKLNTTIGMYQTTLWELEDKHSLIKKVTIGSIVVNVGLIAFLFLK